MAQPPHPVELTFSRSDLPTEYNGYTNKLNGRRKPAWQDYAGTICNSMAPFLPEI